jgi:uncharacterized protein
MAGTFEIYPSGTQWRFRLKSRNGEIVAGGEAYSTKAAAKEGAESVQKAAAGATVVEVEK